MFPRRLPHIKKMAPSNLEVTEARFKRFLKELEVYEKRQSFEQTMDSFLDLYSSWKKTHAHALKLRLVMLAFELNRLDHEFSCELLFEPRQAGG